MPEKCGRFSDRTIFVDFTHKKYSFLEKIIGKYMIFFLRGYPPEGTFHNKAPCRELAKLLTLGQIYGII